MCVHMGASSEDAYGPEGTTAAPQGTHNGRATHAPVIVTKSVLRTSFLAHLVCLPDTEPADFLRDFFLSELCVTNG